MQTFQPQSRSPFHFNIIIQTRPIRIRMKLVGVNRNYIKQTNLAKATRIASVQTSTHGAHGLLSHTFDPITKNQYVLSSEHVLQLYCGWHRMGFYQTCVLPRSWQILIFKPNGVKLLFKQSFLSTRRIA